MKLFPNTKEWVGEQCFFSVLQIQREKHVFINIATRSGFLFLPLLFSHSNCHWEMKAMFSTMCNNDLHWFPLNDLKCIILVKCHLTTSYFKKDWGAKHFAIHYFSVVCCIMSKKTRLLLHPTAPFSHKGTCQMTLYSMFSDAYIQQSVSLILLRYTYT